MLFVGHAAASGRGARAVKVGARSLDMCRAGVPFVRQAGTERVFMHNRADGPGWTALIDDIVAGRWINPETGEAVRSPCQSIVIRESLDGGEAELVRACGLAGRLAVVADAATYAALGARVARALEPVATVVLDHPHADMATAEVLRARLEGADAVVAVGSGTINDLCKYVTGLDGRRYCVFASAASMNGYASTTASMTLPSGLKVSLPSHAPAGFFVDLAVAAAAPPHLAAAGFGDCLVRSVAQIDWWMSHRLLGSAYSTAPYLLTDADERDLNRLAPALPRGDVEAVGSLFRVLTLCGLGVALTGVSNHGSMGEHQVSHYIDCFAGDRHPGTLHGQQVGVASLTLARLQQRMLADERPPVLRPTRIDEAGMVRRIGGAAAAQCLKLFRRKALDAAGAAAMNARLERTWPELRQECAAFMIPADEMTRLLAAAGGPTTARELGLPADFYREAVLHCREMRDRFSFLDLADDAGLLEDFVAALA
jgi:glycerol-1-phosphate dehydrogenase [NAD(P)+]